MPLQFAIGALQGVFESVFNFISTVITTQIQTWISVFSGIIDFIKNVFTGNWSAAWDSLVGIVRSIWDGLVNIVKSPINAVVDLINGFLRGLNNIRVPDWVPLIGGASVNIPLIPRLKKGASFIPKDFFPAYLDYGERVLTREENAEYTALGGMRGIRQAISDMDGYSPLYTNRGETVITVPLFLDGREIARASAWYMGEQLSWEAR